MQIVNLWDIIQLLKSSRLNIFMAVTLAFFIFLILASNIKGILFNCFHAYDFGIYQQGIINIASGESLNPYITVRGVNAFNDHFMPVLFLAVPFVWISNFHPVGLIIFEWLWFVLFLFLVFRNLKNRNIDTPKILYSLGLIVCSKGILTGLEFPIHPGTWSMPVWFLLISSIKSDRKKKVVIYSIILCMFREAYPFGIFLLGIYYYFKRHFVTGSALTIFSALYLYFVLVLRKEVLGPVADYSSKLLKGVFTNPIEYLIYIFSKFDFLVVGKVFLPSIVLLVAILFLERKNGKKLSLSDWRLPALITVLPLYGIHFLTNQYHFHYGPAFLAPLLSIAFLSPGFLQLFDYKKLSIVVMVLFLATASGRYTKFFKRFFLSQSKKCSFQSQYRDETKEMIEKTKNIPLDKIIMASGGVIQRVMRPGIKIYPPHTMVAMPASSDVLLFVREGAGDTYPWTKEQVEKAIKNCNKYSTKTLMNSKYYYLAEGQFPRECIDVYQ